MKLPTANPSGMSLVELLTTMAVIGIVVTVALPNITNISSSATRVKNQQNAQYIVSVAAAVRAAGYTNAWADEDALLDDLSVGITQRNMSFSISPLGPDEITGAKQYFYLVNNTAYYNSDGTPSP